MIKEVKCTRSYKIGDKLTNKETGEVAEIIDRDGDMYTFLKDDGTHFYGKIAAK